MLEMGYTRTNDTVRHQVTIKTYLAQLLAMLLPVTLLSMIVVVGIVVVVGAGIDGKS